MLQAGKDQRLRIAVAVLATAARRSDWNGTAADICAVTTPGFLMFEWVPVEVRYASIRSLYAAGSRCPRLPDVLVRKITESDVCRTRKKGLDLWAVGGVLHLVEHGEPISRLMNLLSRTPQPTSAVAIAETVSLWPAGPALEAARNFVRDHDRDTHLRFRIALELVARGEGEWRTVAIAAACLPTDAAWFRRDDWQKLFDADGPAEDLVIAPSGSAQPHAYSQTVEYLMRKSADSSDAAAALDAFLSRGTDRTAELRLAVANWLHQQANFSGFPLRLAAAAQQKTPPFDLLVGAPAKLVHETVTAALTGGRMTISEANLVMVLNADGVDAVARDDVCQRIMVEGQSHSARSVAAGRLRKRLARRGKLRRVAETFAWGVATGRELTARLFSVEMIGGTDLGYTRLEQNKIYINPLPILRFERHGREIVEGLIVHEFGHHMYHRGEREQEVWQTAQRENLHGVLNLAADGHLDRNLRVARQKGCLAVANGQVLFEMEKAGFGFARFMRALRMGMGNRHNDPKVAAALKLFKGDFRQSSMDHLYEISIRLREIFGSETALWESFGQDTSLRGDEGDLLVHGDGITNDELQREVRRITDPRELRRSRKGGRSGGGVRTINVIPEENFDTITSVVPVDYDPEAHAVYARQVARHARRMRIYLERVGMHLEPEHRRLSGRRLDRTRLRGAILRGDPRILIACRVVLATDLFIGVLIDCSGSMEISSTADGTSNIGRAKLFAAMLAEACEGLWGVDVRLFGFTDSEICDAGDANGPAVHSLAADGGNNDAAALWHAAQVARDSRRGAKLLVMISDGLPTGCSVSALRALVTRLSNRMNICCAQVAVHPLEEICFPHCVVLQDDDSNQAIRRFGQIVGRLVRTALSR